MPLYCHAVLKEVRYWALKNAWSMDGLPGTNIGQTTMRREKITPLKKMVGPLAPTQYRNDNAGFSLEHLILASMLSALVTVLLLLYGPQCTDMLLGRGHEISNRSGGEKFWF